MTAILMRCSLAARPPAPHWPPGVRFGMFGEIESRDVYGVLSRAADAANLPFADFADWWAGLTLHPDYDASLCLAAYSANGRPLAVAACTTSASILHFAVDPPVQRRGLGRAMLLQALTAFWARGAPLAYLKVDEANTQARAFFRAVGMTEAPNLDR